MLPQGFTRVEWIESTGGQYIDTGFKPSKEYLRVVFDFVYTANHDTTTLFGSEGSGLNYSICPYGSGPAFYVGDSAQLVSVSTELYTHYTLDATANNGTLAIKIAGSEKNVNYSGTIQKNFTLALLGNNINGAVSQKCKIKLDGAKIYAEESALARNYVPFINKNGDANLWDEINQEPAEKVGTFTHGSPIVPDALKNLMQISAQNGMAFSWALSENANEYIILRDGAQIASVYGNVTSYTDVGAIGEHTYTVTPYNGIQAGAEASITIRTELDTPAKLNVSLDDRTITLTWDAVSGAEGYKVYRDGGVVASVTSTTYTDTLTPPASVAYAVSAYAGTIQSEISQTVVVENWEGVLLTLITDRTAADVAEAKRLRDKLLAGEELTEEESARYFAGLRGCYNASDMNRVGAAVRYVANRLNAEGYGAYISPKTDWQMEDIVRQSDWNKYLDEVRHLRRKLTLMRTTPQITDGMYSGLKSYAEANAIEQILVDLDIAITCIIRNYIFSGEVFAGEV